MNIMDEILTRGVANIIPGKGQLENALNSGKKLNIYFGIDPTGAQLHLGHTVPLRKLQAFAEAGHQVIFLVGSFTAMIGDPSGRDMMREPLTREQVKQNFKDYKRQAEKVLDFSKAEIRYNDEWLAPLGFTDILKLASNFTVQQMLQRDMFARRIGEGKPIALHEFLYPLMVGYDSVVLDVDCELGGSDQEFNMLAGRHLQEVCGKREKFVLTTPLIEGTDGRKMSKTYNNCVYLDDIPADMYGKLMSIRDELVPKYFECLTDVPTEEIKSILAGHPKEAKMRLAREIVGMYHNAEAAQKAESDFDTMFTKGGVPDDIQTHSVAKDTLLRSVLSDVFAESGVKVRINFQQGAVSEVGGEVIKDPNTLVTRDITLQYGKHRFIKLIVA